jgi:PAS domain S-box-containing protein
MDYLHKFHLAEAEKARVLGQFLEAEELYEQAIASAAEHECIEEEALAYELAAEHYLARGREKFAQTYIKEAHSCYERSGAAAKVKDLETFYPKFFTVNNDIAQRRQAEEALQRSEARFRNIFENSQIGILRVRICDGLILNANQRFAELFGFDSPEEMIGIETTTGFYVNPSDRQHFLELLKRDREVRSYEAQMRKRDGTVFWVLFSSYLNADGDYIEGVIADISDHKQAEEALQRSEAKFRAIFENSQVGIYRSRLSDRLLLDANQRFANLYGFDSPEEIIGIEHTADYYVNPSDRQQFLELLKRDGEVRNFEAQMRKRDGTVFWVLFSSYLNAADGYIEGVVADVSDRKQAEEALQRSEAKFRAIFC